MIDHSRRFEMVLQLVNIDLLLSHLFLHLHLNEADRELSCVLIW